MVRRVGGGILIAVSVAVTVIVDKMDVHLTNEQGMWLLVACGVLALIGLTLALWPGPKELPSQNDARRPSTTLRVRGGGTFDLEDIDSSADTLIDAKEAEKVSLRKGRHTPSQ